MKIFIYDFQTRGRIEAFCTAAGYRVLTIQQVRRRRRVSQHATFFLREIDMLLLETTIPTPDSHFFLAQAMLAQKPILCLYRKNFPPREILRLVQSRDIPTVKTFSYTKHSIAYAMQRFIEEFHPKQQHHDEEPTIKYTLRLSPKCDRYISWVCKRERISKADYFRLFLEQQRQHDPNYLDEGPVSTQPTRSRRTRGRETF